MLLSIHDEYQADFFRLWRRNVRRTRCLSGATEHIRTKGLVGTQLVWGFPASCRLMVSPRDATPRQRAAGKKIRRGWDAGGGGERASARGQA